MAEEAVLCVCVCVACGGLISEAVNPPQYDGTRLATGSYDGQARIWSESGQLLAVLNRHRGPVFSLRWNRSGNYLLSGSVDHMAIIWDVNTGKVKQEFEFHMGEFLPPVTFLTCSGYVATETSPMLYHNVGAGDEFSLERDEALHV